MKFLATIGNGITKANTFIARVVSYLIYPIIFVIVIEVFFRYILKAPTPYTYDLSWMMYGTMIFLGGAYALADNVHVKADIIYNSLKRKAKLVIDVLCYPAFFFTTVAALIYSTYILMANAWAFNEISRMTSWGPPTGPVRTILFISFVILGLQGIVKFGELIRDAVKGGDDT